MQSDSVGHNKKARCQALKHTRTLTSFYKFYKIPNNTFNVSLKTIWNHSVPTYLYQASEKFAFNASGI